MSKNMEYRKHRIEYLRTTVEYSLFGGEGGTGEARFMSIRKRGVMKSS